MPKERYKKQWTVTRTRDATAKAKTKAISNCKHKRRWCGLLLLCLVIPVPFFGFGSGISTEVFFGLKDIKDKLHVPVPIDLLMVGPDQDLIEAATEFVLSREQAYANAQIHARWKMRGVGHLYHYHNLTLTALGTQNAVLIFNVHPATSRSFQDCHLVTLWAIVQGPEVFAGMPQAINITHTGTSTTNDNDNHNDNHKKYKCYWKFQFANGGQQQAVLPGNYTVNVKLMQWNGMAKVQLYAAPQFSGQGSDSQYGPVSSQCPHTHTGQFISTEAYQKAPFNTTLIGFKFYEPLSACCEMCRRTPLCQYWATPPHQLPLPSRSGNGCELFFHQAAQDVPHSQVLEETIRKQYTLIAQEKAAAPASNNNPQTTTKSVVKAWGSPQSDNDQVAYFLGCGWSELFHNEFPCLSEDLDDQIWIQQPIIVIHPTSTTPKQKQAPSPQLPLCEAQDEYVAINSNEFSLANQRYRLDNNDNHTATNPTSRQIIGRWIQKPHPTTDECPMPYEILKGPYSSQNAISRPDPNRPYCWYRDDLSLLNKHKPCKQINCRQHDQQQQQQQQTTSHKQYQEEWMAVWNNYHCDYMDFTDQQLSQCFQTLKIASIDTRGASISGFMKKYFLTRLANVTMYSPAQNNNDPEAKYVWVKTLHWPHLLWHQSMDAWEATLQKEKRKAHEIVFWITPFFISSERETYLHLGRAMQFMDVAEQVLTPKGYQMINLFDPSAAFTYDTAGQQDGLHIIGPPMKLAVTKVFHHLCSKVVEGTRI